MKIGHFAWLLGKSTYGADAIIRYFEDGPDVDEILKALALASNIDDEELSSQAQEAHAELIAARARYRT